MQSPSDTETARSPRKKDSARPSTIIEPQRILELGNGLELWKVHPSSLREQDINARSMPKAMFERLAQTISRDKRLESLPLCAKTERGLEIVSGHHRTRAATAAGLQEMFILVDITGLSRSQIAAKQLAHNAIEGEDNEQLLAEIYRQLEDAESKLEAFIDAKLDVEIPKVKIDALDVAIDFKTALLFFLPKVKTKFDEAIEYIKVYRGSIDAVYVASESDYEPVKEAIQRIHAEFDVRVVSDALGKMAELAMTACGKSVEDGERVHIKDLVGTAWIPKEAAMIIRQALQKMLKEGEITQTNRWQVLEMWAANYLAGR
jgi:hypothetical protein